MMFSNLNVDKNNAFVASEITVAGVISVAESIGRNEMFRKFIFKPRITHFIITFSIFSMFPKILYIFYVLNASVVK